MEGGGRDHISQEQVLRISFTIRPSIQLQFGLIVFFSFFSSELCREKAMVAYTKPQHRKKEESERLRGGRSNHVY